MMKVVEKLLDWENAGKARLLSVGYSLREPQLLFRKIEDTEVAEQVEKLKIKSQKIKMENEINNLSALPGAEAINTGDIERPQDNKAGGSALLENKEAKPQINFDDFSKIELKVGTILKAEKVEKADKLLKLEVDLGFEKRTIVSGIALHFEPSAIVGKQVVVVTNLAPRKMRGIESNGMILMAEGESGKLHFVGPENIIESGSGVS